MSDNGGNKRIDFEYQMFRKILYAIDNALSAIFAPIRLNWLFFVFMYLLGVVSTWATMPDFKGVEYNTKNLWELFLDLYVLCLILALIPEKVRGKVRLVLYVFLYLLTFIDLFCFVKFGSTITPTMLMLLGETDARETGEFFSNYLTPDLLQTTLMLIPLLIVLNIVISQRKRLYRFMSSEQLLVFLRGDHFSKHYGALLGILVAVLLYFAYNESYDNKRLTCRILSMNTIGDVEKALTEKKKPRLYLPTERLVFSIYSNKLAARQLDKILATKDRVVVDSCSFSSPNIVLIIGESYNRHHSSQYGYYKDTAPRQTELQKQGSLVAFSDVVSPWNLTSYVFKLMFSTYAWGDKGDWCDYPLFPLLFRKAGYNVTFMTNEFMSQPKEAVYDFSGGFFINNPELSEAQFSHRNGRLHPFDNGLLQDYDSLKHFNTANNLIIFHLMGQHVDYRKRYPRKQRRWTEVDYDRPDLEKRQRDLLAFYDNACAYNDSIVYEITRRFEDQDAIVIYVPDHGEECFDEGVKFNGRLHSAAITPRLARNEFDIPFWIWCSPSCINSRPDVYQQIMRAKDRRFMTDALPHLLLYLAGIHCPYYRDDLNVLSSSYNESRPRMLKARTDYDKIMEEEQRKNNKE